MAEHKTWKVDLFRTPSGKSPVGQFIKEQNRNTYAKILHSIILLRDNGPFLKPPQIKKLDKGLYELRIQGEDTIRIFYTIQRGQFWLLHAFKKKSQKTPSRDVKTALDRIKELI